MEKNRSVDLLLAISFILSSQLSESQKLEKVNSKTYIHIHTQARLTVNTEVRGQVSQLSDRVTNHIHTHDLAKF